VKRRYFELNRQGHKGAVAARMVGGHFPTEQAAIKVLYLTVRERRPNRSNLTGRINGWKSILNTLAITYGDRLDPQLSRSY
jgi:transposase-like protein